MKTKRKLLLLLLSFNVLFILIFAQFSRGSYTNDVTIDLLRDSIYESIYEGDQYDAYYANSNKEHFIYMNFSYSISGSKIELSATRFKEDLSPLEVQLSYMHSKHNETVLEFRVMREVIGDRIMVSIDSTDIIFVLNPERAPVPSSPEEGYVEEKKSSEEEEEEKPGFFIGDWVVGFINLYNTNPWMWMITAFLFSCFVIRVWRITEKPYCYVQNDKKYKKEYLGRFIGEERSDDLPNYWKQKFKSNNGINIFYNKMNFKTMKTHMFNSIAYLHQYYPAIIHREVTLFESLQFPDKIREDTRWNTFKYIMYRLVCIFIPSGKIAEIFHNWISYEDKYEMKVTKRQEARRIRKKPKIIETREFRKDKQGELIPAMVTKINVLQHELLLKKIKTVCDIKYKEWVIDEEKGRLKKNRYKFRVPLYILHDIKKDTNVVKGSVKVRREYKIPVPVPDMDQAKKEKHDIDEIISIHDMELQEKDLKYKKLTQKYHNSRNINRSLVSQRAEDIEQFISEFQEQALYNENDLPKILGRAVGVRNFTGDKALAVKTAMLEHFNKKTKESKEKDLLLEDKRDEELINLKKNNQKLISFISQMKEGLPYNISITEDAEDDITQQ